MSNLGDEKSDWSYLLPAAFSDDKIVNSSRCIRSRLIHAQSKAPIDLRLTTKMLEFLSRAVADEVDGSNRTCQWPMWQLNTAVSAVNDVRLIDGQSEDGVSIEEKSCVDENGKSVSGCLQTRDYREGAIVIAKAKEDLRKIEFTQGGKPEFEIDGAKLLLRLK
ncbi:hypothetical protein NL676_021606 [Syzygium grande]|nr:hypothetical protein NL676_021606 [Syzygium grande]